LPPFPSLLNTFSAVGFLNYLPPKARFDSFAPFWFFPSLSPSNHKRLPKKQLGRVLNSGFPLLVCCALLAFFIAMVVSGKDSLL